MGSLPIFYYKGIGSDKLVLLIFPINPPLESVLNFCYTTPIDLLINNNKAGR